MTPSQVDTICIIFLAVSAPSTSHLQPPQVWILPWFVKVFLRLGQND